jgi:hypothetical protein
VVIVVDSVDGEFMRARRFLGLALSTGLLGGGLSGIPAQADPPAATLGSLTAGAGIQAGPPAQAAVAGGANGSASGKRAQASLTVDVYGPIQYTGLTSSYVHAQVTVKEKAAAGKVRLSEGKKTLTTVRLARGTAVIAVPESLAKGKHKLTVTYLPASPAKVARATKKMRITVKVPTAQDKARLGTDYCQAIFARVPPIAITMTSGSEPTKRELARAATSADAIAAVAPDADAAEIWTLGADAMRYLAGKLSLVTLIQRHPQAIAGAAYTPQFADLLRAQGKTCGL